MISMNSEPIDKLQGADVCTIVDHPQLRGYQHHIITHIGLNPEDEDISQSKTCPNCGWCSGGRDPFCKRCRFKPKCNCHRSNPRCKRSNRVS